LPTGGLSGRPTRRNAKASPINSRTNAFYIPSYQWVVKGGWNIADCVTRSYEVEGMHVGTLAAGRIGLAALRQASSPASACSFPLRARQDHDHGRLDDDARPCDDEPGLLMMLTSRTLWGLCSYFLPTMA
jgi:hypothetical protein